MRFAALAAFLLAAASAGAQPAPWRLDVAGVVSGYGADLAVHVERRVVGPLALGAGRTEWGGATTTLALRHPLGVLTPRVSVGGSTVTGGFGWLRPTVAAGLDVRLAGPLGAGVEVAHTTGTATQSGTAVRAGLRLHGPAVLHPDAGLRLFPDGLGLAASHLQATTDAVLAIGRRDVFGGASGVAEWTRGGALGVGVTAQAVGALVFGDTDCGLFGGCPSGRRRDGWASAGPFASVATRHRFLNLWLRGGPEAVVVWAPGDVDMAPGLAGAVGLDLFPVATVGVGVAVGGALNAVVPTASYRAGLRVRLPD